MAIIKSLSENYIVVNGPDIVVFLRKFLLYSENFPDFQLLFGLPEKCLFYKGLTLHTAGFDCMCNVLFLKQNTGVVYGCSL